VAFALVERGLHLPFSIYSTFALEARFGFNRATPAMFLGDRIKGVALSALLGSHCFMVYFGCCASCLRLVAPWLGGVDGSDDRHEPDLSRRHRAVVQ